MNVFDDKLPIENGLMEIGEEFSMWLAQCHGHPVSAEKVTYLRCAKLLLTEMTQPVLEQTP